MSWVFVFKLLLVYRQGLWWLFWFSRVQFAYDEHEQIIQATLQILQDYMPLNVCEKCERKRSSSNSSNDGNDKNREY